MIKVGFIGVGGIAAVHLRFLQARRDVRVVALCDIKPATLRHQTAEFGGRPYHYFHDMLAREQLDAVWLCTPPEVRRAPLLDCARRGIAVFCEKPVERDATVAAWIARAQARLDAQVQVGYVFRALPLVARLRAAMADDTIRVVQSFYGCPMSRERSMPAWFFDKRKSGGALVDQATHNFDLLRCLFGEVRAVCGMAHNPAQPKRGAYTIDETLALCLHFENGLVGTHTHSWLADGWRNEIFLSGEKRVYRLNLGTQVLTVDDGARSRAHACARGSMYAHENRLFLRMLTRHDGRSNPCTYADGLRTLQLTLAADRAIETRRTMNG